MAYGGSFDQSSSVLSQSGIGGSYGSSWDSSASYGSGYGAGFGGASSYESSYGAGLGGASYGGGYGASFGGASLYDGGYGAGAGGASSYESSSFESSSGLGGGLGYAAGGGLGYAAGGYASDYAGSAGYGAEGSNAQWSQYGANVTGAGLYQDSNPQIIRRPAPGGGVTYKQNILVRFLQPPPVPPPGPLIIREVRPPQPPAPPPLRIRQQAPSRPQPPPLILRERPPQPPQTVASQTVIRRLAGLPVPPRSVIIERLPPLPPKPRDIVIERWIPYGPQAKRRTIVQRAGAAQQYARPRNTIIQYETPQVRVVKQFQRLGVQSENPAAYVSRYGGQLVDAVTLVQHARAAGVVEDITPPAGAAFGYSGAGGYASGGYAGAGGLGYEASSSSFESSGFGGAGGFVGAGGFAADQSASSFESVGGAQSITYPVGGDVASSGFSGNAAAAQQYGGAAGARESFSYLVGPDVAIGAPETHTGRYDAAGAMFKFADYNHDGTLDQQEFSSFMHQL